MYIMTPYSSFHDVTFFFLLQLESCINLQLEIAVRVRISVTAPGYLVRCACAEFVATKRFDYCGIATSGIN